MNENNFNETANNEAPEVNSAKPVGEENTASGVIFNEDGTYSSGSIKYTATPAEEEIPAAEEKAAPEEGKSQYEAPRTPYRENVNPYSAGARPNPNQPGGYPYGNNQGAPRSSYPYGNGGYPYGNAPYQNYNNQQPPAGNPYNMPPRNHGYAYNPNTNPPKKSKGPKVFAIVAGVLCVFLVIALAAIVLGDSGNKAVSTLPEQTTVNSDVEEYTTNASPVTGNGINSSGELSAKAIYQKVLPSSYVTPSYLERHVIRPLVNS